MNKRFQIIADKMPELLNELESKPLVSRQNLKDVPESGVYVFYEKGKAIYVGRSNRMKDRLLEHGRKSSDQYSATFAIRIAKDEFPPQNQKMTTKELREIPQFERLFSETKERVAQMEIRYVMIEEQIEQAIFEIYAHMELKTQYNDFKTH